MAFLWDLDDEMGNWETPTTILRSKAELRQDDNQSQNADHEIVIEKLTNILTQMRTGLRKDKRQTRKDKRNGKLLNQHPPVSLVSLSLLVLNTYFFFL